MTTHLWGTWLALKGLLPFKSNSSNQTFPPLSILKPVKGIDDGFRENIESFFRLDYPEFELIFSVTSEDDPAIAIIQETMQHYPQTQCRLVLSSGGKGLNPKVDNLVRSYPLARWDHILISDSNVRVPPQYLRNLTPHLKDNVGVVTGVVAGTGAENIGGLLESTYLNTFYARWMFISSWVGCPAVVGKSMYFRKSDATRFGGISNLASYIAEDYMTGKAMQYLGLSVKIMNQPVHQFIGKYSFDSFWKRHLRWGRIRKSHAPIAFLFEPLFYSSFSIVFGAVAFNRLWGIPIWTSCLLHLLIWLMADSLLVRRLDKITWRSVPAWVLREFLAPFQWIHMAMGRSVFWRGQTLTLETGGYLKDGISMGRCYQ